MQRRIIAGLVVSLCALLAHTQAAAAARNGVTVVDVSREQVALTPLASIILDQESRLTADDLLKLPQTTPSSGKEIASYGFSNATCWLSLSLENPASSHLQRLLVFEPSWLDDIQVTLIQPDGTTRIFNGGDNLEFGQRAIHHRNGSFQLLLPPGQSRLLVCIKTRDPFIVAMTLWEKSAFYAADSSDARYFGLLYGALAALLIFNLFLFLSMRESIYGAYVAYLLAFLVMHATYNGYLFQWLWPHHPGWSNWAHSISIYLFVLAGLLFAIRFLELHGKLPPAYRLAKWLTLAIIFSFAVTSLGGYGLHVSSAILWVAAYTPFVLLFGVWSFRNGNRSARYFLTATTAGFTGSFITSITVSGLIPYTLLGYRAADIGMLIDAMLLSLALADRLRLSRFETGQAKTELIEATRTYAQQLETRVDERTRELRDANAIKDKFFSIVAHDLRGPIGGLAAYFRIIGSAENFTSETLEKVRVSLDSTRDFLEELLAWARSQRGDIDCHPITFDMSEVALEVQELFSAQAHAKGVRLNLAIEKGSWVYADLAMTRTVLRNLTHNALKFTKHNGSVTASLHANQESCLISIADTGTGLDEETLNNVFRLNAKTRASPGTMEESGSGLGLILCKEFVEKNGGTIGVRSEPGSGSTFWFTLPAARAPEVHGPHAVLERVRSLKVLIAEDDPLQRETSAQLLRGLGCSPLFAVNGIEAVGLASENAFDLILMDIDMPRLDGIEASRRIRASGSCKKIISLSAYSRQELNQLSTEVQFDDYLFKPLTRDALTMVVARHFQSPAEVEHLEELQRAAELTDVR